jgi:uncharacterized protein (TIGR03435 family)
MSMMMMGGGSTTFMARATTMGALVSALRNTSDIGGKPILDKTGFTANFDVARLEWANPSASASPTDASPGSDAPSLFTALEESLGLKLTPTKGPVEVLVIDSIDRPSDN